MDDLGDLFYVVAIIVGGLVSLIGSIKKKKAAQAQKKAQMSSIPHVDMSSDENPDMAEVEKLPEDKTEWGEEDEVKWDDEELSESEQVPSVSESVLQNSVPSPSVSYDSQYVQDLPKEDNVMASAVANNHEGSRSTTELQPENDEDDDMSDTIPDFHLNSVDEVRRAVIYSEVFNRKY